MPKRLTVEPVSVCIRYWRRPLEPPFERTGRGEFCKRAKVDKGEQKKSMVRCVLEVEWRHCPDDIAAFWVKSNARF